MEGLLPDRLKELWGRVDTGHLSPDTAQQQQEVLLDEYRGLWTKALVRENEVDLKRSLLSELATYLNRTDLVAIEARCRAIGSELKAEWERGRRRDTCADAKTAFAHISGISILSPAAVCPHVWLP